jgi:hypothetical protein
MWKANPVQRREDQSKSPEPEVRILGLAWSPISPQALTKKDEKSRTRATFLSWSLCALISQPNLTARP